MENFERSCRLCLGTVSVGNLEEIKGLTRNILDGPLLKLNFEDRGTHVMCNACSLKVLEAYNFKSACLYVDNTIAPYLDNEKALSVDLREIYAKEKGNEQLSNKLDDYNVCRLCMQLITGECVSVLEMEADMIQKYIPEINVTAVRDPVVCTQCFDSFGVHSSFVSNCLEVEMKIESVRDVKVIDTRPCVPSLTSCIKTEELGIDSGGNEPEEALIEDQFNENESNDEEMRIKTEYIEIKSEVDNEQRNTYSDISSRQPDQKDVCNIKKGKCTPQRGILKHKNSSTTEISHKFEHDNSSEITTCSSATQARMYEYVTCDHETGDTRNFPEVQMHKGKGHNVKHGGTLEAQMYKCDMCDYQTKVRNSLRRHMLKHKAASEVQIYKCPTCSFESKYRDSFKRHQLIHRDSLKIEMHKCTTCDYETAHKGDLKKHQLVHRDPLEVRMYKCSACDFDTMHRHRLRRHKLLHHDSLEIKTHKCSTCQYETAVKNDLTKHQLIHKHPSEVQMYTCDKCTFATRHKEYLRAHMSTHRDPSEMRMYKCGECDFETKYRGSFSDHRLIHRDSSEVQMYKCDSCTFETRHKKNLSAHMLTHRENSKARMYKCSECDFESKYQGSLSGHRLTHLDPVKIKMHKCCMCGYKTRHKGSLTRHLLRHKDRKSNSIPVAQT